jgi:hypothetical protein
MCDGWGWEVGADPELAPSASKGELLLNPTLGNGPGQSPVTAVQELYVSV